MEAVDHRHLGSWALIGLLLLALLATLHFAQALLMPVVVALILNLVFSPVVRALKKIHVPATLSAGLIVLGLLAGIAGGIYNLAEPAGEWLDKAPQALREISGKTRRITGSVKDVSSATEQVKDMTEDLTGDGEQKVPEVTVKTESLASRVMGAAREFAISVVSILILLYFLLASEDLFLRKVVSLTPRLADKKRAVDISKRVEAEVSTYLFTVATINFALGCTVALAMYFLQVPNPVLWGVMVGSFNFIPYLGDIASFSVLTIVGLLTFDELWRGLLVPGVFYVITAIEGYVVTPMVLGMRLKLHPVVIILSVMFWGWLWGVLGALLAVPLLVVLKTFCDRVESLQAFGEFLGE